MLRDGYSQAALAVLSTVLIASQAPAWRQSPGNGPPISGSARLVGFVIAADDGRPVSKAAVTLLGRADAQLDVRRTVDTGVDGRFDFPNLPAGSYYLRIEALNGFVPLDSSERVTLTAAQTAERTVRLQRTGAIQGRIYDENGDALLGAEVQAIRRFSVGSHTSLRAQGGPVTANDRGEFRLFNLPPGEYYVVASPPRRHERADNPPQTAMRRPITPARWHCGTRRSYQCGQAQIAMN